MDNVHVGVQVRTAPEQVVRADVAEARWEVEIQVLGVGGERDFRGPAVHGPKGARFLYLTWGNVGPDGEFEMFRRAKLVLDRIDPEVVGRAIDGGLMTAVVDLTGPDAGPRCARVDPPAITWSG